MKAAVKVADKTFNIIDKLNLPLSPDERCARLVEMWYEAKDESIRLCNSECNFYGVTINFGCICRACYHALRARTADLDEAVVRLNSLGDVSAARQIKSMSQERKDNHVANRKAAMEVIGDEGCIENFDTYFYGVDSNEACQGVCFLCENDMILDATFKANLSLDESSVM